MAREKVTKTPKARRAAVSKLQETTSSPKLQPVTAREPLGRYLQSLWNSRNFITTQAQAKATSQHYGMFLGNLWLVLSPLLDALGFYFIFGVILQVNRGIENFPAFLVIGIYLFSFTIRSINSSAGIVQANRGLIMAFKFPRAAIPLAQVLREVIVMVPTLFVLLAFIMINPPHELPATTWVIFPVIIVLQTILNLGFSLFVARITNRLPDLIHLISFITRFWMYGSGVMFPLERFINQPGLMVAVELNPAYQAIDMTRKVLMQETLPDPKQWVILAAWAFGMLVFGFIYFWRGEVDYGRER